MGITEWKQRDERSPVDAMMAEVLGTGPVALVASCPHSLTYASAGRACQVVDSYSDDPPRVILEVYDATSHRLVGVVEIFPNGSIEVIYR